MRRRLFWLVALAGLGWLWLRRGARRPQPVVDIPPVGGPADDPAEELRRKLDETKGRAEESAESPAPAGAEDLDAKRREVHDRARSAADEMRGSSSD
jgi:hypothetical protein